MGNRKLSALLVAGEWRDQWVDWIPWLGRELISGIGWWNVFAAVFALILTGLLHLFLRWVVGRKLRPVSVEGFREPEYETAWRRWSNPLFDAVQAPLAVFVWVYGTYAALVLFFLNWWLVSPLPVFLAGIDLVRDFAYFLIFLWLLFRLIGVIDLRLRERARRSGNHWDPVLAPLVGRTLRLMLPLVAVVAALPGFPFPEGFRPVLRNGVSVLLVVFIAVILFQAIRAFEEGILESFRVDVADNLRARKVHTQVTVLAKVAMIVVGIFGLASVLMVFEPLRRFGTSILASAGIAGIIIGFAAQRSLGTLLAGFQIAITQPIRLDDVVIVEEEWGRIEEITLTYVVVKLWDLRRLVLPIDYFIREPFQNWTRTSSELLGTVYLYLDYRVPTERIRVALRRILDESLLWDGKTGLVQVTDANERTVELRILLSSPDAGRAFDLRCEVREKLIEFIRTDFPEALPRFRAEFHRLDAGGLGGGE